MTKRIKAKKAKTAKKAKSRTKRVVEAKRTIGRKKPLAEAKKKTAKKAKKKTVKKTKKKTVKKETKKKKVKKIGPPRVPLAAMLLLLRKKKVPTMVQHCILRVYPKMKGTPLSKFSGAYNICTAVFQDNGYLSESSPTKMTGKGATRNRKHQRESVAGRKTRLFDAVVEKIFGAVFKKLDDKEAKEKSK